MYFLFPDKDGLELGKLAVQIVRNVDLSSTVMLDS